MSELLFNTRWLFYIYFVVCLKGIFSPKVAGKVDSRLSKEKIFQGNLLMMDVFDEYRIKFINYELIY